MSLLLLVLTDAESSEHQRLLKATLAPPEVQQLADEAVLDKVELMLQKGLAVPCEDERLERRRSARPSQLQQPIR